MTTHPEYILSQCPVENVYINTDVPGSDYTCLEISALCAGILVPKDRSVSLHRFPREPSKRREWIMALALKDEDIKDYQRVCSGHFPNADPRNKPELCVGKLFASPKKSWTSRAKRAKTREVVRSLTPQMSSCSAHSVTPGAPSVTPDL